MGREQFAASYLIVEGERAAFIDNNTSKAVPGMLQALADAGLAPEQVEYVIITHVHLDHAGGTSALMSACPNATVLAHPRAARHVIDPARLVASASAVYGEQGFRDLYGSIEPVPEARVRSMDDEQTLRFGARELRFMHTRGHANHHFCIADSATGSIFTGDAFGLIYPALQATGTFAIPSTSPTDFDAELAQASIRRIVDQRPARVYPTHYGAVTDIQAAADQLLRHLEFAGALAAAAERSDLEDDALTGYAHARLRDYFAGLLDSRGVLGGDPRAWSLLEMDIDLNAQGIAFAANRKRRKAREARA
jgi:glyoxylase-like metal-dependent hydrolase (beta-lactamase superfamily II)